MLWLLATPTVDTETKVRSNTLLGGLDVDLLQPVSDASPWHALRCQLPSLAAVGEGLSGQGWPSFMIRLKTALEAAPPCAPGPGR